MAELQISPHKVVLEPKGRYPNVLTLNGEGFGFYEPMQILLNGNPVFDFAAENAGQFIVQMKTSELSLGQNDIQAISESAESNIVYVVMVEGKG